MASDTIEITNCNGPIEHAVLHVRRGALTLAGRSNLGKTQLLKCVERVAGGKQDLRPRYGCENGTVAGLGVTITVGRTTRRSGDLNVLSIEDSFRLEDLIDPGYDDPVACDRARIKALLRIAGAKADMTVFADLLPGGKAELEKYVSASAAQETDLVELAGKLKRAMEDAARKASDEFHRELGVAAGCKQALEGVNLSGETDATVLQENHTAAVRRESKLREQERAYRQAAKARREAESKLSEHGQQYDGPTAAEAKAAEDDAKLTVNSTMAELAEATAALQRAEHAAEKARISYSAAISVRKAAKSHEQSLRDAQGALAATMPEAVDQEALDAAGDAVEDARHAIERAAIVRAAKAKAAEAKAHEESAERLRERAECLRLAAKETDACLSRAVASKRLRVEDGRVVCEVPDKGLQPYHEQSDGFRTALALSEALDRVRELDPDPEKTAIVVLPQRCRQDLQPSVWNELVAWAVKTNTCIASAIVTNDSELVVTNEP